MITREKLEELIHISKLMKFSSFVSEESFLTLKEKIVVEYYVFDNKNIIIINELANEGTIVGVLQQIIFQIKMSFIYSKIENITHLDIRNRLYFDIAKSLNYKNDFSNFIWLFKKEESFFEIDINNDYSIKELN